MLSGALLANDNHERAGHQLSIPSEADLRNCISLFIRMIILLISGVQIREGQCNAVDKFLQGWSEGNVRD